MRTAKRKPYAKRPENLEKSKEFKDRLYYLIKEKGLTLTGFVDKWNKDHESKYEQITIDGLNAWVGGRSYPGDFWKLNYMADFFGVSIDFLVGRDDCRTITNEKIHEITGLSESAINNICRFANLKPTAENTEKVAAMLCINELLSSDSFYDSVINAVIKYKRSAFIARNENYREYYDECLDILLGNQLLNYYDLIKEGIDGQEALRVCLNVTKSNTKQYTDIMSEGANVDGLRYEASRQFVNLIESLYEDRFKQK